jgi:polyhydroxyalkanoate synthase
MAASKDNPSKSGAPDDVAASATDGMLGPNPFVGVRPCDILATAQQIGAQAVQHPTLLVEQAILPGATR